MQEYYPFELVGAKCVFISHTRLNPLRVLDSRGWPDLSRDSPLDSVTQCVRVPDSIQDVSVPMRYSCRLDPRWTSAGEVGPRNLFNLKQSSVEHPL